MKAFTKLSTAFPASARVSLALRVRIAVAGVCLALLCGAQSAHPPADLAARAEAGDPWAQLNLGAAFDHGIGGVRRDPRQAVAWYRRAAESGLAEAQFNLAHCLATGEGVPRDDVAARRWMLRAAAQGVVEAQFLAGVMLLEGVGGAADPSGAREWLQHAAENGNPDAAVLLDRQSPTVSGD